MTDMTLRIATYNIRKCLGTDRRRDAQRTLRVIERLDADIVMLQEADMRLGHRPPAFSPHLLQAHGLRHVAFDHGRDSLGWHGNAILIRDEIEVLSTDHADLPGFEPRGAVLAELRYKGRDIRAIGVHLGLLRRSRRAQLTALQQFSRHDDAKPTVLAGDFNEWFGAAHLTAMGTALRLLPAPPTFHARRPVVALDRIAVTHHFESHGVAAALTHDTRRASDHLPLVATLDLKD